MTSKRLIDALVQFIPLIILVTLVFGIAGGYVNYFVYETEYTATTTFYVMNSANEPVADGNTYSSSMLTYYEMLAKDYSVLATSRSVTMTVAKNLNLENLRDYEVKVENQGDTRVMVLTVIGKDPTKATMVADEMVSVFTEKVKSTIGAENVNVIDYAYLKTTGPNRKQNTVLCAFAGMVLTVGIIILREFLDTTLRTVEDIENTLDIPVLAQVNRIKSPRKVDDKKKGTESDKKKK